MVVRAVWLRLRNFGGRMDGIESNATILNRGVRGRILRAAMMLVLGAGIISGPLRQTALAADTSSTAVGLDSLPPNTTCIAPTRPTLQGALSFPAVINWRGPEGSDVVTVMVQRPGDSKAWIVGDRSGLFYNYREGAPTFTRLGKFADLRTQTVSDRGDMGMLSAAFPPDFDTSREVYLFYVHTRDGATYEPRLSRFKVNDNGASGLSIDASSEEVLVSLVDTAIFHKGGLMFFGADGYLYVGTGDGASDATKAQSLGDLHGKILRIDVTHRPSYAIPPDNPFVNVPGARPEVYALGLRNPFRGWFNRATSEILLGDVGAISWEEIDVVHKGNNLGWPIREGTHCYGSAICSTAGLTDPILEYSHNGGTSAVVGGGIYTGSSIPGLQGRYLFGDVERQQLWALETDEQGKSTARQLATLPTLLFGFVFDQNGELYLLGQGRVMKMNPPTNAPSSTFPQKLSQTGCVDPANATLPATGVIPYRVNMQLWSDGADKDRWMALPQGGKITVRADGDWDFPIGTVLMKQFRLQEKRVETRLFMRHDDGDWGGYSYEWNDAQTDATLLPGAKLKTIGSQQWLYPSRDQCMQCHNSASGRSLGLETPQLNGMMYYPQTGRTANQILTLSYLGLFDAPIGDPSTLPAFPALVDATVPVDLRARAYLHSNCSVCHRPGGPGQGPQDFRYYIPGMQMNIFNVAATQGDFGINGAKLFAPGDPDHSMILQRMHFIQPGRMPPLASSIEHRAGTQLIDQWIRSSLGFGIPDTDHDGFADNVDNCPKVANPDQRDTNGNGRGNRCDADLNNDGIVNALDLGIFKKRFGTHDPDADFNGDGIVNALDLGILKSLFGTVSK